MLLRFYGWLSVVASAVICLLTDAFESWRWIWMLPVVAIGVLSVLVILTFVVLMIACSLVDVEKEPEGESPFYRRMTEIILDALLPFLQIHIKKSGMEKVPAEGRFLLVCNHVNNSDPLLLLNCFQGYELGFIAKKETKHMFVIGPILNKLQCSLINRENDREALKTILRCIKMLKEDKASVGVFPEGKISDDRKLHRFRPGVFKIAQKAQVPIVVCTLKNTNHVIDNLPKFKPSFVEMTVLETIPVEEITGIPTTEIAERIYQMMAADLGPENVSTEE